MLQINSQKYYLVFYFKKWHECKNKKEVTVQVKKGKPRPPQLAYTLQTPAHIKRAPGLFGCSDIFPKPNPNFSNLSHISSNFLNYCNRRFTIKDKEILNHSFDRSIKLWCKSEIPLVIIVFSRNHASRRCRSSLSTEPHNLCSVPMRPQSDREQLLG